MRIFFLQSCLRFSHILVMLYAFVPTRFLNATQQDKEVTIDRSAILELHRIKEFSA